jgi:predicted nucleic acid-binding protein
VKKLICDTDFLSSFLKIGRLKLVSDFYEVLKITIPPAVYAEISQSSHLAGLLAGSHEVSVESPDVGRASELRERFPHLGLGEIECLALTFGEESCLVLASDRHTRVVAKELGIKVANISAFLLDCKGSGFLKVEEISKIIDELKDKDFYEFSSDDEKALLE